MKDNFAPSFVFTEGFEGGWADNPHDAGGPTNKGVTLATLSHELGRRATFYELQHLSSETVAAIFKKKFWNAVDADNLPAGVDLILFDIAVNSGPGRALQFKMLTAGLSPCARIRKIDALRTGFWRHLRNWKVFGKGWMRRENACLALAIKLAGA